MAVYTASLWPWFAVNELLYIFVILYKKVKMEQKMSFKKRRKNYFIGYVYITVIPLSLGTKLSSMKNLKYKKK